MDDLKKYLEAAGEPIREPGRAGDGREPDATAYNYYDEEGNYIGSGWVNKGDPDPVGQKVYRNPDGTYSTLSNDLTKAVDTLASSYTPTIKIKKDGSGLTLSGTKNALDSDLAEELRNYLKESLQYQNLQSENTAKIIEELNEDIADQIKRSVVENGIGANYDEYKDYAHAMEVLSSTNPMRKTGDKNKIVGLLKDGTPDAKTPDEWRKYYEENYGAVARAKLFADSVKAMGEGTDFHAYTPYLVMSGGGRSDTPIYGFSLGEKIEAGVAEYLNEASAKIIEGGARGVLRGVSFLINSPGYARRNVLNSVARDFMGEDVTSNDVPWISEEEFNEKLDSMSDKSPRALNKEEKSLLIVALSVGTGLSGLQIREYIDAADTVGDMRENISYQTYIDNRDNLQTTEQYDKEIDKADEALKSGRSWLQEDIDAASIYAPVSVGVGRFLGTMTRYLAESAAIQGLTGGSIALNQIGDVTLGKITDLALRASQGGFGGNFATTGNAIVKALNTPLGHFLGAVATEIPEDIVQTAVDNVITAHGDENWTLLTPDSIATNTLQNLIMRAAFIPVGAAVDSIRMRNALKRAQRETGLAKSVHIDGAFDDNNALRYATASGRVTGVTEDGKYKIVGDDGVEHVLDNTYVLAFRDMDEEPVLQELALRYQPKGETVTMDAIDRAKKAVESGEYTGEVEISIEPAPIVSKFESYDDWEFARRQAVDEAIDLGDDRPRSEIESEWEVENPAPPKPGAKIEEGEPVVIYRADIVSGDPTVSRALAQIYDGSESGYVFSKTSPMIFDGMYVVKTRVEPQHILTFKMADSVIGETSKIVERGGDILNKYAEQHNVSPETVIRASSGDPAALAELSGRPVVEGGWLIQGLDDGQYRYYPAINEDFDRNVMNQSLASTNPQTPEANVANAEMALSAQNSIETAPYNKTPAEIIADIYKKSGPISDAPNSASIKWEIPDVDGSYQDLRHAMADQPTNLTMDQVKQWFNKTLNTTRKYYIENIAPAFDERYPTATDKKTFVRTMHYLFDLQKMDGRTLEQSIGKTFIDIDGVRLTVTRQDVDFYNEVIAPYMKELRDYSLAGLGISPESAERIITVGYLPHTSYDPTDMTSEEALQQATLYKRYSGASASTEDGNFTTTTLSDDLQTEFDIFAKNMIWDSLGKKAIVAKYMQELHADGVEATAESVEEMINENQALVEAVTGTKVARDLNKELNGDVERSAELSENIKVQQEKIATTEKEIKDLAPSRGVNKNIINIDRYKNSNDEVDFNTVKNFDSTYYKSGGKSKITPEEKIILESSLVDSAPATNRYGDFQKAANVKRRNALRTKGYNNLSPKQQAEIDRIDGMFSQKLTTDMVVYRGESATEYSDNLSVGDPIDSSSWTYVALTGKYTDSYRTHTGSGGVLYRYHLKDGQPVHFHPPMGEMGLPRGISGTVTSIKNNVGGKVFGKFIPEKIIDVEVEPSGVTSGVTSREWGDMGTPEGKIKQNYDRSVVLESRLVQEKDALEEIKNSINKSGDVDWGQKNDADIPKAAKKVGATEKLNSAYSKVYGQAKGEYYRSPSLISVQQTSDVMRKIATPDGDMYSNGGRMVVSSAADAGYMAKRIFDQAESGRVDAKNIKQMFIDYLAQGGKRTQKGAEYIADQWMQKILKDVNSGGDITRRALTARLNSLIYFEGSSRLKRWIGRADVGKFNSKTVDWMDEFFFRQGLLGRQLSSPDAMSWLNKATNKLISARMKSLFWLNFKNGVLQASECVRIFTEFEMGDALKTISRLASDKEFAANVDKWVELLVPERNLSKVAEATDALDMIAQKSKIVDGDISVAKLSKGEEASLFKKIDEAAMTPIDMGENLKNRVLIAGILQEAERKGFEGDALFNFVNKKFERIGLANNEMGRLAGADNPLFRIATNLKSFSIRQFGMYINNIHDMNDGEVVGYILKNLGWKIGIATILAKLGYSVPQSLGIDPFDILDDDYTGVDEEDYNLVDKVVAGPAGRLLLSGGFTSYLADAYWAARQAYEQRIATPEDEVNRKFSDRGIFELAMPNVSFDNMLDLGAGFIPGYTQGKRVLDMAELQAGGWAVSATGNIMYAAPDNAFDAATGYVFGRSNTPNARTYYQTADPLQGLVEGGAPGFAQQFFGRGFNLGGGYRNFDPVDRQNYSDWFYGDSRDDQQWNAGYYYFREQAQKMLDEYQKALSNSYNEDDRNAVYNSYNSQLRALDDGIAKFVQAYQEKNPGKFDANKMNNILTVMRTYNPDVSADDLARDEQFFAANNAALQRYTAAGLPQQVSYKYNTESGETEVEYSPQVRAAMQGRYGLPEEASRLIQRVYNDKWKDLNKEYRDKYYSAKGSAAKKSIQNDYFNLVRKDLDPIVAMYGAEIFSNDTVSDIMEDVFNSMMPYGVTSKKYLQEKYKDYMAGSISYSQPGNETIAEIRSLLDQGKTARGKALARTLLQRVQENRQALTRNELEWLQGVLND